MRNHFRRNTNLEGDLSVVDKNAVLSSLHNFSKPNMSVRSRDFFIFEHIIHGYEMERSLKALPPRDRRNDIAAAVYGSPLKHVTFGKLLHSPPYKAVAFDGLSVLEEPLRRIRHNLFSLVEPAPLKEALHQALLDTQNKRYKHCFRDYQCEILKHFSLMNAEALQQMVSNNLYHVACTGKVFNPQFRSFDCDGVELGVVSPSEEITRERATALFRTLHQVKILVQDMWKNQKKYSKHASLPVGFEHRITQGQYLKLMENIFFEFPSRTIRHRNVHQQRKRVDVDPDAIQVQSSLDSESMFDKCYRMCPEFHHRIRQSRILNVQLLRASNVVYASGVPLMNLDQHLCAVFPWQKPSVSFIVPISEWAAWCPLLKKERRFDVVDVQSSLDSPRKLFKKLGSKIESQSWFLSPKEIEGAINRGVDNFSSRAGEFAADASGKALAFNDDFHGKFRENVEHCASVARAVTKETCEQVRVTGESLIASARQQAMSLLSADMSDVADLVVSLLESITICWMSDQATVRWISIFGFFHRIFTFFKMHKYIGVFIQSVLDFLAQSGREIVSWLKRHVLACLPILGVHVPVTEDDSPIQVQALSLEFFAAKMLMERTLSYGIEKFKELKQDFLDKKSWLDLAASLKEDHKNLYFLIEGVRLIRASGGAVWVKRDPANASMAYFVSLQALACDTRYSVEVPPISRAALKAFSDSAKEFATAADVSGNQARCGSTIVYLYGEAGQGKSTLLERLRKDVNDALGVVPNTTCYTPTRTSDYHEGYCGQKICLLNDIFVSNSSEDRRRESSFLMDAHDCLPISLDMANAALKGATFFTSPFVFATSNFDIMSASSASYGLSNAAAMRRRIDFFVTVKCKDPDDLSGPETEWKPCTVNGMLNEKLIAENYPDGLPDSAFELNVRTSDGEQKLMKYSEMLEAIKAEYEKRLLRYEAQKDLLSGADCATFILEHANCHEFAPVIEYRTSVPVPGVPFTGFRRVSDNKWLPAAIETCQANKTATVVVCALVVAASAVIALKVCKRKQAPKRKYVVESKHSEPALRAGRTRLRIRVEGVEPISSKGFVQQQDERLVAESVELQGYLTTPSERWKLDRHVASKNEIFIDVAEPIQRIDTACSHHYVVQGCDDPSALELLGGRLVQQTYKCRLTGTDGRACHCQAFNFCDRYLVVPLHSWYMIGSLHLLELWGSRDYRIDRSFVRFVTDLPTAEAVVLELDKYSGFIQGSNLIPRICSESEHVDAGSHIVVATRLMNSKATSAFFGCSKLEMMSTFDRAGLAEKKIRLLSGYRYPDVQTFSGMCCSPVVLMNQSMRGKIIGLHCAGNMNFHGGYAAPITREMFKDFQPQVQAPIQVQSECDFRLVASVTGLALEGLTSPSLSQSQPIKSSIRPSPIYGRFSKPSRQPAVLRFTKGIDPMIKGQLKMVCPSFTVDKDLLMQIENYMANSTYALRVRNGCSEVRRLTVHESLNGKPGVWDSLVLKTSPGFPYNKLRAGSKCAWTIGEAGAIQLVPEMQQAVDLINAQLDQGVVPQAVFRDSLKDEKREIAKIESVSTRVFSAAPMDFTICLRQDFLDISSQLQKLCVESPIAVGIDAHGPDWGNLCRRFDRICGDNCMYGDVKTFDGTLPAGLIWVSVSVLARQYKDGGYDRRMVWPQSIANALHVVDNLVFRMSHGMPSGVALTSLLNGICNWGYHLLAWMSVGYSLREWDDYVEAHFYGDDSLVKVHPDYTRFNMVSMRDFCRTIGVEYTMGDKKSDFEMYKPFSQCTFLKRAFVKRDGIVFAPLDWTTLMDFPNWVRSDDPGEQREALISTCESFYQEMSHYPEKLFHEYSNVLSSIMADAGYLSVVPQFSELMKRYD